MSRKTILLSLLLLTLSWMTAAGDLPVISTASQDDQPRNLYRVSIGSQKDAAALAGIGADPLLPVTNGYLVLMLPEEEARLAGSGLAYSLVASTITRGSVMMDIRADGSNAGRFPLVFEDGGIRLYRVSPADRAEGEETRGLAPLRTEHLRIAYTDPDAPRQRLGTPALHEDLDALVSRVTQDSVAHYSYLLQGYPYRQAGSNASCAQWLYNRFIALGYDSVYYHYFYDASSKLCRNVVAVKTGTLYPLEHVIVGAHYDTEPVSPGADDNGSGVIGVMEMARVLRDVETNLTFVFILFDAEEEGLIGAWYYASRAAEEGERIPVVLNMDMIAYYKNTNKAKLFHGPSTAYGELWIQLADSLPSVNITGYLAGPSGGSDHAPFIAFGYDGIFVHEYIFSSVYHSARDSTTYLNFDYFTRMIRGTLAVGYYTDASYTPAPDLMISCPDGAATILYPGMETIMRVRIIEYAGGILVPGSARLQYTTSEGASGSIPLVNVGGDMYEAVIPSLPCGEEIEYCASAVEGISESFRFYPDGGEKVRAISAAAQVVALDDNFNTDQGWTASGNATSGVWDRWKARSNAADPAFDYDGSGWCYMTDHNLYSDVDGGTTSLISPAIDVTAGKAYVEYARWYSNAGGITQHTDTFRVYVANGNNWVLVEEVGPREDADGGWYQRSFWVNDYFTPQVPLRLRFDAGDTGLDSRVEAAVDAVKVTLYYVSPYIITDAIADAALGVFYSQPLEAAICNDPAVWRDKNGDLTGTGLTLSPEGVITGTPAAVGTVAFTAEAEDATGRISEKAYTLLILNPLICGDGGRDGAVNVGDVVYLINYVFKSGPAPYPVCAGDANGDGNTNVGDAVHLINYVFKAGPGPSANCCL
jgi:hypothetical protein